MPSCNEEGCSVLTTGKCVNGLDINVCPHYSLVDPVESLTLDEPVTEKVIEEIGSGLALTNVVEVHSGKALKLEEVNRISKSALTRLIILAGMPNAGKTTLLLSLMHLFATKSAYEGYIFAGSETLLDFEEKSHPSKIDSEKEEADTGRTPLGQPTFLHLKIADPAKDEATVDLLFTDISGELFRALKDSTAECRKFTLGLRADHFTLFFDTHMLTSIGDRALSKAAGLGILRGLVEAETILPGTNIQIVFSRWDLFSDKEGKENHEQFISLLKEEITQQYGSRFKIGFFEVSCRPKNDKFPFGYGLDKIFPLWVKDSSQNFNAIKQNEVSYLATQRQFMKFQFKN